MFGGAKSAAEEMSVETAIGKMLDGGMNDAEIAAQLVEINRKGFSVEEIRGAAAALRARMTPFEGAGDAIDCCGTGGDQAGTLNVSTATAFVLAGGGCRVAKHGNRAVSSQSGSTDVLGALGVKTDVPAEVMQKAIRDARICFLAAPLYHPAMKQVAAARKSLGQRTIFNLLGPLANPAGVKRQLIGVFDESYCAIFCEILKQLGSARAWVVHGHDGLDEISTTGASKVSELDKGNIRHFSVKPDDVFIKPVKLQALKGGDATVNAQRMLELLRGEAGPYRDIVLMNAAAGLIVTGSAKNLEEGMAEARKSIDSGAAKAALNKLIAITQGTA